MVEEKHTRPSDPEELIRLSAKGELLPCYNCGGEGKLHEVNVFGYPMVCIECENCVKCVGLYGIKAEYGRMPFEKEEHWFTVPIKDAKEQCALQWNFLPERLSDRKMEEITSRREWKEWRR